MGVKDGIAGWVYKHFSASERPSMASHLLLNIVFKSFNFKISFMLYIEKFQTAQTFGLVVKGKEVSFRSGLSSLIVLLA